MTLVILRSATNGDLPDQIAVGTHKPAWEVGECPSCGSAPCGPHPDWLICRECEDDWPCAPVQVVMFELEQQARALYRRADNLPLTTEQQIQRLGDFREIADRLVGRANELRGAP